MFICVAMAQSDYEWLHKCVIDAVVVSFVMLVNVKTLNAVNKY